MNAQREHEAFLNAIIDNPDDDLPRLVFADYLEETGDGERAEFIRIQCELVGGVTDANRKIALGEREKELLSRYSEAWRVPIRGYQKFQRGFIESLWASADNLLQAPYEIVTGSTLRTLRITNADQRIDDLAEYPGFSRIEHLDLTNNNLSGDYRLRAILGNNTLTRLRGLNLHNNRIWADDVLRIARSPVAAKLTHLDLSGNGIGTDGAAYLANDAGFSNVEVLNLRSDGLPEYECFDADAMERLTSLGSVLKPRVLDVADHHIREQGMALLFIASRNWNTEYLNIAHNRLGERAGFGKALSAVKNGWSMRNLDYSRNSLSFHEAEHLLNWPPLDTMEAFRLTGCDMIEETRALLEGSPHAAKFHLDDGDAS